MFPCVGKAHADAHVGKDHHVGNDHDDAKKAQLRKFTEQLPPASDTTSAARRELLRTITSDEGLGMFYAMVSVGRDLDEFVKEWGPAITVLNVVFWGRVVLYLDNREKARQTFEYAQQFVLTEATVSFRLTNDNVGASVSYPYWTNATVVLANKGARKFQFVDLEGKRDTLDLAAHPELPNVAFDVHLEECTHALVFAAFFPRIGTLQLISSSLTPEHNFPQTLSWILQKRRVQTLNLLYTMSEGMDANLVRFAEEVALNRELWRCVQTLAINNRLDGMSTEIINATIARLELESPLKPPLEIDTLTLDPKSELATRMLLLLFAPRELVMWLDRTGIPALHTHAWHLPSRLEVLQVTSSLITVTDIQLSKEIVRWLRVAQQTRGPLRLRSLKLPVIVDAETWTWLLELSNLRQLVATVLCAPHIDISARALSVEFQYTPDLYAMLARVPLGDTMTISTCDRHARPIARRRAEPGLELLTITWPAADKKIGEKHTIERSALRTIHAHNSDEVIIRCPYGKTAQAVELPVLPTSTLASHFVDLVRGFPTLRYLALVDHDATQHIQSLDYLIQTHRAICERVPANSRLQELDVFALKQEPIAFATAFMLAAQWSVSIQVDSAMDPYIPMAKPYQQRTNYTREIAETALHTHNLGAQYRCRTHMLVLRAGAGAVPWMLSCAFFATNIDDLAVLVLDHASETIQLLFDTICTLLVLRSDAAAPLTIGETKLPGGLRTSRVLTSFQGERRTLKSVVKSLRRHMTDTSVDPNFRAIVLQRLDAGKLLLPTTDELVPPPPPSQ